MASRPSDLCGCGFAGPEPTETHLNSVRTQLGSLSRVFGDRGLVARYANYWLYLPKVYVMKQFQLQFGFRPLFLAAWPGDDIPIPSVDVLVAYLEKPARD